MSTTLTNGLKLPDKGSVDWYADMQSNYAILDGAVGTVAEHTTALAGKAPAVHTHTKADITDFPAYGTTAGTICEGNDSRLSDARTPVAHTHTKSDVTDLLNSNFIPSANNSYDLGSSSYQWNKLYAKNYYYNGTAWGLDRVNTWSADQIIQNAGIGLKNTSISQGSSATTGGSVITLIDKNNQRLISINTRVTSASRTVIELKVQNTYKNGVLSADSDAELIASNWYFGHLWNGTPYYTLTGYCDTDIIPKDNNSKNLGTSNLKWKTFNGLNPGALSLPKIVAKATADISSAIVGTDGETQYLDGSDNYYTAALDGWISICIGGFTQDNKLWITVYDQFNETWGTSAESSTSERNTLFIIFPIRANQKMRIRMKCTTVTYARFYPCEGNV